MSQDNNGMLPGGPTGVAGPRRRYPAPGVATQDPGNAPTPVYGGQPTPAPPAAPRTAAPMAEGGGQVLTAGPQMAAAPTAYANPFTAPPVTGAGPKTAQPGGDVWQPGRRALGPESRGTPVQTSAPIGPAVPQTMTAPAPSPVRTPAPQWTPMGRDRESESGVTSPFPTPKNPSPAGPGRQAGAGILKGAVGAPREGGYQQPSWGNPWSGSSGLPNTGATNMPVQPPGGRRQLGPESRGGFNPNGGVSV